MRLHEDLLPLSFLPLAVFFTCHFLLGLPECSKYLTKHSPLFVQGDHHYHSSQCRLDKGDKGVSLTLTPWAAWQSHQCSWSCADLHLWSIWTHTKLSSGFGNRVHGKTYNPDCATLQEAAEQLKGNLHQGFATDRQTNLHSCPGISPWRVCLSSSTSRAREGKSQKLGGRNAVAEGLRWHHSRPPLWALARFR